MHAKTVLLTALTALSAAAAARPARADALPIITLTDLGPDQQIPTDRSFYVQGAIGPTVQAAQAVVVRAGSPSLFGGPGPACGELLGNLHFAAATTTQADEDVDDELSPRVTPRFPVGRHPVFELFPDAAPAVRGLPALVSAAWLRDAAGTAQYRVLVPHERAFFAPGFTYCMFVVATDHAQAIGDRALGELIEGVTRRFVACGDNSSCADDALDDLEAYVARELAHSPSLAATSPGDVRVIAATFKEAVRAKLASSTGVIEARDHVAEHWAHDASVLMPSPAGWADPSHDPFARAVASLLARSSTLDGSDRALVTADGRLRVKALEVAADGRQIRVASSSKPAAGQAHAVDATTDALAIGDGVTLYDLIQLGHGQLRVGARWVSLADLGAHLSSFGLPTWSERDAVDLAAAATQARRLAAFVKGATGGVSCGAPPAPGADGDAAARQQLGEWLVCQHADAPGLEALATQLDELEREDKRWRQTRTELVTQTRRIATLTTTAATGARVGFSSRTWVFSYLTPIIGYADVARPGESFGMFYVGAQLHLAPNPVDDVLWRDGVTVNDLRRAVALEVAVAPDGGSFGPADRFSGPGALPPVLLGLAIHIVPYTSVTLGGMLLDRKNSTLPEERPHTIVAPYLGFTLQLNLPDLIWQASHPNSDTTATR